MKSGHRTTAERALEGFRAFEPNYWLRRCEGFAVVSADGRLGYVEEVRFGSRIDRPDCIVFRSRLRRRLVVVPTSEIEEIVPEREQITLRSAPSAESADVRAIGSVALPAGPEGRPAA